MTGAPTDDRPRPNGAGGEGPTRGRVTIECARCGRSADVKASDVRRGQRHCSRACRLAAGARARAFRCPTCGAEGASDDGRQRYCSPECARLAGRPAEDAPCASCGRVARLTYRAGDALCCSARCARTARAHLRRVAIEAAGEQRCSRCREVRPLSAFDRLEIGRAAPTYRTYCRACARPP